MTYTVTTTTKLRQLCIDNNWFTSGDINQYEKLFYANENGFSISEIATIIWICSGEEHKKKDIETTLRLSRREYVTNILR